MRVKILPEDEDGKVLFGETVGPPIGGEYEVVLDNGGADSIVTVNEARIRKARWDEVGSDDDEDII